MSSLVLIVLVVAGVACFGLVMALLLHARLRRSRSEANQPSAAPTTIKIDPNQLALMMKLPTQKTAIQNSTRMPPPVQCPPLNAMATSAPQQIGGQHTNVLAREATTKIQAAARGLQARRKVRASFLNRHASQRAELVLSNRDSSLLKDRPSRRSELRRSEAASEPASQLADEATRTIQAAARSMESRQKARMSFFAQNESHRAELQLSSRDPSSLKDRPNSSRRSSRQRDSSDGVLVRAGVSSASCSAMDAIMLERTQRTIADLFRSERDAITLERTRRAVADLFHAEREDGASPPDKQQPVALPQPHPTVAKSPDATADDAPAQQRVATPLASDEGTLEELYSVDVRQVSFSADTDPSARPLVPSCVITGRAPQLSQSSDTRPSYRI